MKTGSQIFSRWPGMRDLDIAETRNKLAVYARAGPLGPVSCGAIPLLGDASGTLSR